MGKGFDFKPQGALLEQVIEETTEMAVAYERSHHFYKDFHAHDRLILVFPRASCRMRVGIKNPDASYTIDARDCLLVPAEVVHDDESLSSIYDTFAILPSVKLIHGAISKGNLSPDFAVQLQKSCHKIKRTPWLEQLVHQYFYGRIIARQPGTEDCEYLEKKILMEVFSLMNPVAGVEKRLLRSSQFSNIDSVAIRALKYIESNLFMNMNLKLLARHTGASLSTLTREFKKEIGQSPYSYIKERRLEEAMLLLKKGDRSVAEVSLLVGYENFGAFSEAFKSKYKKPPSAFLKNT